MDDNAEEEEKNRTRIVTRGKREEKVKGERRRQKWTRRRGMMNKYDEDKGDKKDTEDEEDEEDKLDKKKKRTRKTKSRTRKRREEKAQERKNR